MKIIALNRKASFLYEIIDRYEVGIILCGTEVKSLRAGKVQLQDAFVLPYDGELFLQNAHIAPYEQGNINNHEPLRRRKLLLKKSEIIRITEKIEKKGLTAVPLKIYFKERWVKLEVAICRGKAKRDRRQDKMKEEARRQIARALRATQR